MRIRSGYSFRTAVGHLNDVVARQAELGFTTAVLTDRDSTFGLRRFRDACAKKNLNPAYGVELGTVNQFGEKKPVINYCTFLAKDDIKSINLLVQESTSNPGKDPTLLLSNALKAEGVVKIIGERATFDQLRAISAAPDTYLALSPSAPKKLIRTAIEVGIPLIATSDNYYVVKEEIEFYRVTLGKRSNTQTYPMYILSDDEWRESVKFVVSKEEAEAALNNRNKILSSLKAELVSAELYKPERLKTLYDMCVEGAKRTGTDLNDPVYAARLERELTMIKEKEFEDYFYIIADIVNWAKERMIVGPARGSSCGSLVCYLLNITTIDPIPFGLIFERFIDINRKDLPDIDIDFSDKRRDMVFDYMESRYGSDRVARLGTVGLFKPRSALKQTASVLRIPDWRVEKVLDSIIVRSSGDARAMYALEDTINQTEAGRQMLAMFPNVLVAARMEGHPNNPSQHAAGILVTQDPTINYVAIDARTNAAMVDKKDAEYLNLLKIDALGLTQLSIFERTLQLIGESDVSGWLEKLPLDDQKAFDVLNDKKFAGIFQFMGGSLQSLTKQIHIDKVDDIISITALARPGPMASGGSNTWVKRRLGLSPVETMHPLLDNLTEETYGIIIYQEQIMRIAREVGKMSWEDTSELRKAMSKSLGKEFFDRYWEKFKVGAIENGVPEETAEEIWNSINAYGSWCLSGDTVLENPFPSRGDNKFFTLKELYDRGGLGPSKVNSAKRKRQSILMWDGNSLAPHENWGVTYSGKKKTFSLKTETGESIRATAEHKFLMPNGEYMQLKELKVGMSVIVDAGIIPTERKKKKGTGSGGHNWWHKLKEGEPLYSRNVEYLHTMNKFCQNCKNAPYEETHHINMDHDDNRIENLLPVCRKCHKKLHALISGHPSPWQKGRAIASSEIISIEEYGEEDVYDVSMPSPHHNFLANGIVVHNCFNKSHAVAYGIVSYYCCYLKAHYPLEFCAATLDAESDPLKQIKLLRELHYEGIGYVPFDVDYSTDRWEVADKEGKQILVGPLTSIKGIGPSTVIEILGSRKSGEPLRTTLKKKLDNAKTEIDSIFPVKDSVARMHPNLEDTGIVTVPTPIIKTQCGLSGEVVVIGVARKIVPRDENEQINIAKRGGKVITDGRTASLNLFVLDDTDEIFCKVDRFNYEKLGRAIVERGRPGKAIYAIKGTVPPKFRMIAVRNVKFLGYLDEG